jgi:hypothetical protein
VQAKNADDARGDLVSPVKVTPPVTHPNSSTHVLKMSLFGLMCCIFVYWGVFSIHCSFIDAVLT